MFEETLIELSRLQREALRRLIDARRNEQLGLLWNGQTAGSSKSLLNSLRREASESDSGHSSKN